MREVGAKDLLTWIAGSDLCFPNLDEARVLTGADTSRRGRGALSRSHRLVAATCGADGGVIASGMRMLGSIAPELLPVDSTGAGDAFGAGLVGAWTCARPDGARPGEGRRPSGPRRREAG